MPVGQGLYKRLAYKKQTGLGVPASGAGGQLLRRATATFNKAKDTYSSDEIVSHQQYTGDTYGPSKTQGQVNGELSAGTYAPLIGSICRKDMANGASAASVSLTIAGAGPHTITRSAGSYLTDGFKIGDVVRITAGTYTGTARDINLVVTAMTATVLTVIVANGKVLSAQGPIASSTIAVIGKKSVVPVTGHTNDYYTFEEWHSDLTRSRVYSDAQMASAAISIPATGNATIQLSALGLSRSKGASQILTSPTSETTTAILAAANGIILVAGSRTLVGTSLSLTIDGQLQHGEPVIGSNAISDIVKGDVKVSGSLTVQYDAETISDLFDNETPAAIIGILFADTSDTASFVGFTVPRAKIMGDDIDDGKKQLVMTCPFTAEINSAGGAALANDQGIVSVQDSAA
jgi:hypothetical protein